MTQYLKPSFSVPQSGRDPKECSHGWIAKGRCVFCGTSPLVPIDATYGAGWHGETPTAIDPTGWLVVPPTPPEALAALAAAPTEETE